MQFRAMQMGVCAAAVMAISGIAGASAIITTAVGGGADTTLSNDSSHASTYVGGSSTSMEIRNDDGVRAKLAMIRFDLSSVSAAQRNGAVLSFTITSEPHARDRTFDIYGLTDESLDNWDESTTSYSNAPGMLTPTQGDDAGYFDIDSGEWSLLGTIGMAGANPQTVSSDNGEADTSLDLDSFLASDTNNLVSFLIIDSNSDTNADYIVASKEDTTDNAPPALTFANVPEPASLSLLAIGALGLRRRRC